MKRSVVWLLILACLISSLGCRPAALPYMLVDPTRDHDVEDELKGKKDAKSYCELLATRTDVTAQRQTIGGLLLGMLASGALVTGAAMGPGPENSWWIDRNRNTVVIGLAPLAAIPAVYLMTRAKDNSEASAAATKAMMLNDEEAYNQCLAARSDAVGARVSSIDAAMRELSKRSKTTDAIGKANYYSGRKQALQLELTTLQAELNSTTQAPDATKREVLVTRIDEIKKKLKATEDRLDGLDKEIAE